MRVTLVERNELMLTAAQNMMATDVLVDIGCGIVPQNYIRPNVHICCEPYREYVVHLQKKIAEIDAPDRCYTVLNMSWSDVVRYFPEKSVDTVMLVDVIEHLDKNEGRQLLLATEKIARKQVVIFTPLGFMPQHHPDGKDAWGLNGGDWQEHKSGWVPEDFQGDDWQFFVSPDFHIVDNLLNTLDETFGAFWAIKTYDSDKKVHLVDREIILQNLEIKLKQQQLFLQQKENEINKRILSRVIRKIQRMFLKN